jgi:hypothetical protein
MKEEYVFTREENGWILEMPHPNKTDTRYTLVFQDGDISDSTAHLLQAESLQKAIQAAFSFWTQTRLRGGLEVLSHKKGSSSTEDCTVYVQGKPIC